jgi:hypothetical protein
MKWIDFREHKPTKNGEYLCKMIEDNCTYFDIYTWSDDLYNISNSDFYDKKGKSGFARYDSDWNEWWDVTPNDRYYGKGYKLYYISMEELDEELEENP